MAKFADSENKKNDAKNYFSQFKIILILFFSLNI